VPTLLGFVGELTVSGKPHWGWIFCAVFQWEWRVVTNESAPLHLCASNLAKEVGSHSNLQVHPCSALIQAWKSHFPQIPQFANASMGGMLLMTLKTVMWMQLQFQGIAAPLFLALSTNRFGCGISWQVRSMCWTFTKNWSTQTHFQAMAPASSLALITDYSVWDESTQCRTSRYIQDLYPRGEGHLIFVPPGERLPDDANILTIPHSFIALIFPQAPHVVNPLVSPCRAVCLSKALEKCANKCGHDSLLWNRDQVKQARFQRERT